jgi:1,4-alpha-glucan branching enzyme
VDFPRAGNQWSYHYARRQWSLRDNPDLKYHALGDFDAAIMHLVGDPAIFAATPCKHYSHVSDQLLVIQRGALLIAFNFHPVRSFPDHAVPAPEGLWELVLDTDEPRFAGLGRLALRQRYQTINVDGVTQLLLYLPARCALVMARSTSS